MEEAKDICGIANIITPWSYIRVSVFNIHFRMGLQYTCMSIVHMLGSGQYGICNNVRNSAHQFGSPKDL